MFVVCDVCGVVVVVVVLMPVLDMMHCSGSVGRPVCARVVDSAICVGVLVLQRQRQICPTKVVEGGAGSWVCAPLRHRFLGRTF